MKIKELIKILQQLNPDGDVAIVDHDQNYEWSIVEVRTCEDRSSEWFKNYADIAIDIEGMKKCCMCKALVWDYVTDVTDEYYCTECQQEYLHVCDRCDGYAYGDLVEVLVPNGVDENGNPTFVTEYWCEDCTKIDGHKRVCRL